MLRVYGVDNSRLRAGVALLLLGVGTSPVLLVAGLIVTRGRLTLLFDWFAKYLPWISPGLATAVSCLLGLVAVLLLIPRLMRAHRDRLGMVDFYADRLMFQARSRKERTRVVRPEVLQGYRTVAEDYVLLVQKPPAKERLTVPTPNEPVRVLVRNWLDERGVPRL